MDKWSSDLLLFPTMQELPTRIHYFEVHVIAEIVPDYKCHFCSCCCCCFFAIVESFISVYIE